MLVKLLYYLNVKDMLTVYSKYGNLITYRSFVSPTETKVKSCKHAAAHL